MIPITELRMYSEHFKSELKKFEQQFTGFAGTREEVKQLATQFGEGIWCVVKPRLDSAVSVTEHDFGVEGAAGWSAVLTLRGWMFHQGGVLD